MKTFKNILFDLDGTLSDPGPGIVACIQSALREMGHRPPAASELTQYIGPPLRGTFATLLATDDSARIEQAVASYRERFSKTGMFENNVYPGIPEVLEQLASPGTTLFVATAKPRRYAIQIIEYFRLATYFEGIFGPELDGRFDDKGELISHILATYQLQAEESVMIGDRANDIIAAKKNGLSSVGVTYGYGSLDELLSAGACSICESPEQIPETLRQMR